MAATPKSTRIRITRRTLRIAEQLYQMSNIACVEVISYKLDQGEGRFGGVKGLQRRLLATGIGWLIAVFAAMNATRNGSTWAVLATIVCGALAGRYAYYLLRITINQTYHALVLYCGNRLTVISSTDRTPLEQIRELIADVIENPPETEIVRTFTIQNLTIGDHVAGDKIEQHGGTGNVGKVETRSE